MILERPCILGVAIFLQM